MSGIIAAGIEIAQSPAFWQAFGTLAAAAAAVGACLSAISARRAVEVAIAVDANAAARQREREGRDALPVAIAIHWELNQLRLRVEAAISYLGGNDPDETEDRRVQHVVGAATQFDTPILRGAILHLGSLDPELGAVLARSLASAEAFRTALRGEAVGLALPPHDPAQLRGHLLMWAGRCLLQAQAACEQLRAVTGLEYPGWDQLCTTRTPREP